MSDRGRVIFEVEDDGLAKRDGAMSDPRTVYDNTECWQMQNSGGRLNLLKRWAQMAAQDIESLRQELHEQEIINAHGRLHYSCRIEGLEEKRGKQAEAVLDTSNSTANPQIRAMALVMQQGQIDQLRQDVARLAEAKDSQIAANAKHFTRLMDQSRRIDDLEQAVTDLGEPVECELDVTDNETPAAVLREITDLKIRMDDVETFVEGLTGDEISASVSLFDWCQTETDESRDDGYWKAKELCPCHAVSDDAAACWVASDALAMANAFHAFVQAGADQITATDLVRMWLEENRKEREG